jgi:DNA-binding MarR family transcriptional regulator
MDAVRRIVRALRGAERQSEKDVGLGAAQLFVLGQLRDGPALSLNELAERTLTHQSSASVVVTRLVERGLVRRTRSPDDRRRVLLELTPSGRQLLARAPEVPQNRLIDGLRAMSSRRRRLMGRLLAEWIWLTGIANEEASLFFQEPQANNRRSKRSKRPSKHKNPKSNARAKKVRGNNHGA